MNKIFPQKLKKGDEVRIIAPARSLSMIGKDSRDIADKRFEEMGLKLSFGKHVMEIDDFNSSTIESRIEDFHEAFSDPEVKAIITVIGGFNSNQLLRYIDWDLIKNNPKIFCGYSDITVLNNAIYAKTGLVNYNGPHYSSFGQKLHMDHTIEYFRKCLIADEVYEINSSDRWSDDMWYIDQDKRVLIDNPGYVAINSGRAKGTIIGGNVNTLNLLQGTEYFPDLTDSVLFIEDDAGTAPHIFDRDLQSLIHLPDFKKVRGIVIGRFQKESKIDDGLLEKIIKTKKELNILPIIANADFGHTDPKITFPIGGEVSIETKNSHSIITILKH